MLRLSVQEGISFVFMVFNAGNHTLVIPSSARNVWSIYRLIAVTPSMQVGVRKTPYPFWQSRALLPGWNAPAVTKASAAFRIAMNV
jgi:hypothetical protein